MYRALFAGDWHTFMYMTYAFDLVSRYDEKIYIFSLKLLYLSFYLLWDLRENVISFSMEKMRFYEKLYNFLGILAFDRFLP